MEEQEAGSSGRQASEEPAGPGRRAAAVKPKDLAGSVVWARLGKFPWWPAQVLDEGDPWIPSDSEPPRRGAIPVRFFGTYDFSWIESHRSINDWEEHYASHSQQSKEKDFLDAMAEAEAFRSSGQLPDGFNDDGTPSPQKRGRPKRAVAARARRAGRRGLGSPVGRRNVEERQEAILQHLGLTPPPDSPFSHSICLAGVRRLLQAQAAGQWPNPQPAAPITAAVTAAAMAGAPPQHQAQTQQQAYAQQQQQQQQQAYPAGFLPGGFAVTPAQYQHWQLQLAMQQQALQQQQQQQAAGGQAAAEGQAARPQAQWPAQFQAHAAPQGAQPAYFQQAGGVQGALLAAASQAQMQPRPQ